MDTSETLPGNRGRVLVVAVENSGEFPCNQEMRCRAGVLHLAFVADKEVANGARPKAES